MKGNTEVARRARELLAHFANSRRAEENKAYFKSPFSFVGATKEEINGLGRALKKDVRAGGRDGVLSDVACLWRSRVHEEMSLAVVLAALSVDLMQPEDVRGIFSEWLDECQTWDHVDELCIRVTGVLATRCPELWPTIEEWATSAHMWKRRASLISHLPALRSGAARVEQLERTCSSLATESDFFIRKAIGWVLRELSDEDHDSMVKVFQRVGMRLSNLSRREATRKLDADEREALLSSGQQGGTAKRPHATRAASRSRG